MPWDDGLKDDLPEDPMEALWAIWRQYRKFNAGFGVGVGSPRENELLEFVSAHAFLYAFLEANDITVPGIVSPGRASAPELVTTSKEATTEEWSAPAVCLPTGATVGALEAPSKVR